MRRQILPYAVAATAGTVKGSRWPLSIIGLSCLLRHPGSMRHAKPRFEHRNRARISSGHIDSEALVAPEHPVRAIWAVLESLDSPVRQGDAGRSATCLGGTLPHW